MPRGKKLGGRKKGTPNKVTLDLLKTLEEKGFEPAAEMVLIHNEAMKLYRDKVKTQKGWGAGPALDTAKSAVAELMRYCYPQRKAVEVSGKDGGPITFSQLVKDALEGDDDDGSGSDAI